MGSTSPGTIRLVGCEHCGSSPCNNLLPPHVAYSETVALTFVAGAAAFRPVVQEYMLVSNLDLLNSTGHSGLIGAS